MWMDTVDGGTCPASGSRLLLPTSGSPIMELGNPIPALFSGGFDTRHPSVEPAFDVGTRVTYDSLVNLLREREIPDLVLPLSSRSAGRQVFEKHARRRRSRRRRSKIVCTCSFFFSLFFFFYSKKRDAGRATSFAR